MRIFLIFTILLFFSACDNKKHSEISQKKGNKKTVHEFVYPMMGTLLQIKIYGNEKFAEKNAFKIRDNIQSVSDKCNIFNPDSEISKLNKTAYQKAFKCSEMLWNILLFSKKYYEISNGAFDISSKPLMDLWGFYKKRRKLPEKKEIEKTLQKTGLDKVIFNFEDHSVKFEEKGICLDLGGIAKGYAVNSAANFAEKNGVKSAIINLGGNMYCFSNPFPGKKHYTVGIRNPVNKNKVCTAVKLKKSAVATSGNYERYVVFNKRHYTHIMNPVNGKPVEDMISVTVVTENAGDADALSTSAFILGKDFAEKYNREHPDTFFLLIKRSDIDKNEFEIIRIGGIWKEKIILDSIRSSKEN